MPCALLAQVGQRGLNDPHRAEHVGLQLVSQLLLGQLLDSAEHAVARVVHDDVETAEVLLGPLHALEDGGLVGHVQLKRKHRAIIGGDQLIKAFGVPGSSGHLVSAGQSGLDEVAAEAAGRPGDEPDLAHDVLPFFLR